jgi:hypothetical protein
MAPKKKYKAKYLPLAVSQRLINEERLNVARRTQQRQRLINVCRKRGERALDRKINKCKLIVLRMSTPTSM